MKLLIVVLSNRNISLYYFFIPRRAGRGKIDIMCYLLYVFIERREEEEEERKKKKKKKEEIKYNYSLFIIYIL